MKTPIRRPRGRTRQGQGARINIAFNLRSKVSESNLELEVSILKLFLIQYPISKE